nr:MAG TPA: restriction alleviation protein [Caudoviricetes sp.]
MASKEDSICPYCGSPLKYRDHRLRVHKTAGGGKEWYRIRRLKCTNDKCRKLHNELPDCMFPYKHYDAGLIEDVVEGVVSEEDPETEDYPCAGTMKHWKWWAEMNEKNMEGQIRLAAHRFLDFDDVFLKSTGSLLEELKKRISPGWLEAAARFIYNSGGRIEPHPACTCFCSLALAF